MEEGIAVPHARTDLIEKPLVVIGRSVSGIEWDSPDGKPAQFIFLILTPQGDNDSQVQILGHIARIMSEKEMQNKFSDAADESTLWNIVHQAFGDQVVKKRKR
jgi:mannitol/fructose-specific phosphotransferase system IIA component (Ntr-type)